MFYYIHKLQLRKIIEVILPKVSIRFCFNKSICARLLSVVNTNQKRHWYTCFGYARFKCTNSRSSPLEMFYKKGVLKNFVKFTGKHRCQSLFLIKFQAEAYNLLIKRLWHRWFLVNFAKFLRVPFL